MFGEHHFLPLVLINLLGLAGILIWHIQGAVVRLRASSCRSSSFAA